MYVVKNWKWKLKLKIILWHKTNCEQRLRCSRSNTGGTWFCVAFKLGKLHGGAGVGGGGLQGKNVLLIFHVELKLRHTRSTSLPRPHVTVFVQWLSRVKIPPLTWAGTMPSLTSTSGRVHLCPTNTRLNCSRGLPSRLFNAGRSTHTLGRLPSPMRSNSSILLLNCGVILMKVDLRKIKKINPNMPIEHSNHRRQT